MKDIIDKKPFMNLLKEYTGHLDGKNLLKIIKDNNALIAGGAVLAGYYEGGKINDLDIYVNQKDALSLWTDFKILFRDFLLKKSQSKKDYDDSFFKKNKIKGRFVVETQHSEFDFIIIDDEVKPEYVVSNFDLTFCEIWTDGENVYANYPEHVFSKSGILKDDYVKILIEGQNKFIQNRMERYKQKGFQISIPENDYVPQERVKNISSPEKWYVSVMYENIVNGLTNSLRIPALVYFPLKEYTIENLFPISPFLDIRKVVAKKKYKSGQYKQIMDDFNQILKPIFIKNSLILHTNIGIKKSVSYSYEKSPYFIDMSKRFVTLTQYRPLPLYDEDSDLFKTDDNVRTILKSDNPGMIFSCPNGHIHYSDNCGAPLELAVCGIEDCKNLVGGYQHMLAPGNYFVYIRSVSAGYHFVYNGKFPIYDYKTYKQLLKQTNETIIKYSLGDQMKLMPDIDNTLKARRIRPSDELRRDVNKDCGVILTPFDLNENGGIDKNAEDTFILPCGHLMDKSAVDMTREQGKSSDRKCPFDGKKFLFGTNKIQQQAANKNIYIVAKKRNSYLIYQFHNEKWKTRKNGKYYSRWVSDKRLKTLINSTKLTTPTYDGLLNFFKLTDLYIDDQVNKHTVLMTPLKDHDFQYYKKAKKMGYV